MDTNSNIIRNRNWMPLDIICKYSRILVEFGRIGALIILISCSLHSQKIYVTEYKSEADIVLYVSKYKSQANSILYKEQRFDHQASKQKGIISEVDYEHQADITVYFTKYKSKADCIVYFAKWKSQARRNKCF